MDGDVLFESASLDARFGLWRATVGRMQGHGKYKEAIEKVLSANQNVARLCEQRGITREDFNRAIVNFGQWLLDADWSANAILKSVCDDAKRLLLTSRNFNLSKS